MATLTTMTTKKPLNLDAVDLGVESDRDGASAQVPASVPPKKKPRTAEEQTYLGIDMGTTSPRPREQTQTRRVARQAGRAGGTPWPP